jgi:V/A-type H+-transporting ATPase subunit C
MKIQQKASSSDYSYINARIRGMKSRLLSSSDYEDLMGADSFTEAIEILQNTDFAPYLQSSFNASLPSSIDEVLRRNLGESIQKILSLLEGRPRVLFEKLILYWDMENIRTILRGKNSRQSAEDILTSTLPLGRLNEALIEELIKAEDIESVLQILSIWKFPFARELSRALPEFEQTSRLFILEHALEEVFFAEVGQIIPGLSDSEKALGRLLMNLKDLFNLRSALRLREEKIAPEQAPHYFLGKGARVNQSLFLLILNQDTSDAACTLAASALGLAEKPKDEITLERILEHRFLEIGIKSFLGDPLGFDILIGFLWLKISEIRNIRLIVKGKLASIRMDRLENELINAK